MSEDGRNAADDLNDGKIFERGPVLKREGRIPEKPCDKDCRDYALKEVKQDNSKSDLPPEDAHNIRAAGISAPVLANIHSMEQFRGNNARRNRSDDITQYDNNRKIEHCASSSLLGAGISKG
jgi:hypothetical protein